MVRTVVLTVPAIDADVAADRLWAAGARAVEERTGAGARIELHTALSTDDAVSARRLGRLPDTWTLDFADVDVRPEEAWRDFAGPVEINRRLVVLPAWLAGSASPGVLEVAIEPAGSFGLGDHPTTRLCADAVDRLVVPGDHVLDVGCGSGVLAVIAACRGAAHVTGLDISDAAIEATQSNADTNHVADRIVASTERIAVVDGAFDLVVANILAPTLASMGPDLTRLTAPSGRLVISGVLAESYDHVLDALAPMRVVTATVLDGWAAVELAH